MMPIDMSPAAEVLFWHWWIGAVACFIFELIAPGVLFLWLGAGAVVAGFATLIYPEMGWRGESMIFAIVSLVSAVVGRSWWDNFLKKRSGKPELNERAKGLIGKTGTLDEAIVNGVGRLKLGDSSWKVRGPDLPTGAKVRIAGSDGSVLVVEAV